MALTEILGSAVSGLAAAQAGLRSVSNNIANVGTPGYARERVTLSTSVTGGQITGVVVGEPTRVADRFLEATVNRRAGDEGRAEVVSSYLGRLQALLGEPGSEAGLPARLDAISASAVTLTGGQGTAQTAAAFTANVQDALTSMQQLGGDVTALRGDVESEVGFTVEKINSLLERIHDLNGTVSKLGGTGRSTVGALDQRMTAVEELSGLIGITVRDQPDGRITIDTASGAVLLDRKLRQLSYPAGSQGISQPTYPSIDIRFANEGGTAGAATGEKLESAAAGGKLGGLLDLRDRALPDFSEKLGVVFGGLAEALNAASNMGSAVPAPAVLAGRNTGLVASDRLGFTGAATFAVANADGKLVAKTSIDFSAMSAGATVSDLVAQINSGLGGAATASFADGALRIAASGTGNGVVVAQGDPPSARAGIGVSQYFGLNDLVRSDSSALVPSGFTAADPHGFGAGESADIELRDSTGRVLTRYTLTGATGPMIGDLVTELNASPLATSGTFSLDDRGRMRFAPAPNLSGAVLTIPADTTSRLGTGRSFSALLGLNGSSSGLADAQVRSDLLANSALVPLARLQAGAAVGATALAGGDTRGANAFVDRLAQTVDLGKDGVSTVERFSSLLLARTGLQSSQADSALADATARREDAVNRRDSFSGVNIDEELAQMVVLQNSYSAAARVLTTASEMYDTLIQMVR